MSFKRSFVLTSPLVALQTAPGVMDGAAPVVAVFATVLAVRFALEWRLVALPARQRSDVQVSPWSLVLLGASYVVSTIAALLALANSQGYSSASFWTGIIMVCGGYAARLWSIRVLGDSYSFSLHPRSQILVVNGPYRFVRHPVYTAYLVELVGLFIIAPTAGTGVSFIVACILSEYRSRLEEAALTATFGEAFTEFCLGRKRFIPFVY